MFSSTGGYWYDSENVGVTNLINLIRLVPSSKLNNIRFIFSYNGINVLDLTHWIDMTKVRDYTGAMQAMNNLTTIYAANDWDLSRTKVTDSTMSDNLFYSDNKLKGRLGTNYQTSEYGKIMAVLDSVDHRGYLTYFVVAALHWFPSSEETYTYDGTEKFGTLRIYTEDSEYSNVLISYGSDPFCADGTVTVTSSEDVIELNKFINAGDHRAYFKISAPGHAPSQVLDFIRILINKAKMTGVTPPSAVSGLVYNKNPQTLVAPGSSPIGIFLYDTDHTGDFSEGLPNETNAGEYIVSFKVVDPNGNYEDYTSEDVIVTIAKANPNYIAPTANDITYNRQMQDLILPGYTSEGVMQYAKASEGPWSALIPTATNADEYTVYFKIEGDNNHNDINGTLAVTLKKADPTYIPPTPVSIVYNRSPQDIASEGSSSEGALQYALTSEGPWSNTIPTAINAGDYNLNYRIIGDSNHNDLGIFIVPCKINKADPTLVAPTALDLVYNRAAQILLSEGYSSEGSFVYTQTTDSQGQPIDWLTTIPTGTNAGDYPVYYKLIGDSNHNDSVPVILICDIDKANPAYITPTAIPNVEYSGTSEQVLNAGVSSEGTFDYAWALDSQGQQIWSSSLPTFTNVGTYQTWWKLTGDSNHNNAGPGIVMVAVNKTMPHYIAPIPISMLADGDPHHLVIAGITSEGTFRYTIDTDSQGTPINWLTTIPEGTAAGIYRVYFRVLGDDNHGDTTPEFVDSILMALQHKTVWAKPPGTSTQVVTYDTPTYVGLSQVTILQNSEGYIKPQGTITLTSEGNDIDIAEYEYANIDLALNIPKE